MTESKIHRWQRKCKVNGVLKGAKGMAPQMCYKGYQKGKGSSGNAPRRTRLRNFNLKPNWMFGGVGAA